MAKNLMRMIGIGDQGNEVHGFPIQSEQRRQDAIDLATFWSVFEVIGFRSNYCCVLKSFFHQGFGFNRSAVQQFSFPGQRSPDDLVEIVILRLPGKGLVDFADLGDQFWRVAGSSRFFLNG